MVKRSDRAQVLAKSHSLPGVSLLHWLDYYRRLRTRTHTRFSLVPTAAITGATSFPRHLLSLAHSLVFFAALSLSPSVGTCAEHTAAAVFYIRLFCLLPLSLSEDLSVCASCELTTAPARGSLQAWVDCTRIAPSLVFCFCFFLFFALYPRSTRINQRR